MTDFARLVLDADTRGLKDGKRELAGVSRQSRQTAMEVDSAANRMGVAFKRVGQAAIAAGLVTVLYQFGRASAQAAIDAEEMNSAFDVVFGAMADDVRAWAEITGDTLGRSTQEIQRGALAFQELFGKALNPAQATELSKQFAVLTQDLASFKNLSNEVAQQKLFSGLVGEAEPLRSVGVFLNETAVQAKAAELGLEGVNGKLTDQEKIVARAAIIQEQLANATGDVIRTSDSAANQIKTYEAAVEELQVAIGQKLLPALTPLITATAELVTELANAAEGFSITDRNLDDLIEGVRVSIGVVGDITEGLQGMADYVGLTGERIDILFNQVTRFLGPLRNLLDLLEAVGRDSNLRKAASENAPAALWFAESMSVVTQAVNMYQQSTIAANVKTGTLGQSLKEVTKAAKEARDEFADLMETLFPEFGSRQQLSQLALIDANAGRISEERRFQARRRVLGLDQPAEVSPFLTEDTPIQTGVVQEAARIKEALDRTLTGARETFSEMQILAANAFSELGFQFRGLVTGAQSLSDALGNLSLRLAEMLFDNAFSRLGSGIGIPGFASGTNFAPGGLAIVGERGPELVNLPRGSQVLPAPQTRSMMNSPSGSGTTINVYTNDAESFRRGRRQIQRETNRRLG